MKKLLIATALATLPFGALAADLPVRSAAPAPMLVAAHNWTGFYLGAQAGFGITYADTPVYCSAGSGTPCTGVRDTRSTTQPIVGAHFGYNHQLGNLVVGVEADANARFGSSDFFYQPMVSPFDELFIPGLHLNGDASLRARLGVLLTSRTLVYATGGVAFGHVKTKGNITLDPTLNGWQTGWTVGAGVEYAIDTNWSVRAEYRYTDYGTDRTCAGFTSSTDCGSVDLTDHKVAIGVSYRFGGRAAPVVARY
jgi:outer membrane immunogenic protein